MKKLNVMVLFGGCSSEYGVSLESVSSVLRHLDREKYEVVTVGITQSGKWLHYSGSVDAIENDTWQRKNCVPAVLLPDRERHALLLLKESGLETVDIDVALPILHGKNGEDGTVQGLLALAGIPLAGCGVLSSALCMDKDRAHRLAQDAGVRVPKALVLERAFRRETLLGFAGEIGYPLFVKPVKAGSSYGVTKVERQAELEAAVKLAFEYDDQVIVEENIEGFEVGCAVLGNEELFTGAVDEIELSGGFFDFTEKYTLKTSAIHVPARITPGKALEVQETAKVIYRALGCRGFARVDMFLTPEGEILFNEVNTIPGFTAHSRYPGMMRAVGIEFPELLDKILALAVEA